MKNYISILALAAFAAGSAQAAVVIDENGVGFVGKGDVQDAFGWNNAQLQANAADLQFRFVSASETTWKCEEWQNHQRHGVRLLETTEYEVSAAESNVAFDARKNRNGQITGFNLNGFEGSETHSEGDDLEPGTCPPDEGSENNPKWYEFVEGSLETTVVEEGLLEVSVGDGWISILMEIDEID